MRKWWYRRILIIVLLLTSTLGTGVSIEHLKESEEKINDMQGHIQVLQNENAVLETAPIEESDNLTRVEKEQRCFQIEKELTQVHWFRFTYKRKLREELQKLSHEIRQLKDEEVNRRRMLVNERDRKIRQNKEDIKELDEKLKAILENASSEAKRRCNITD